MIYDDIKAIQNPKNKAFLLSIAINSFPEGKSLMASHVKKFLVHHVEKHTRVRVRNRPGVATYSDNDEDVPWPELLGSNDWEGLLEPLNLGLRKLVLRCGDFCQATYDTFNNDKNSKYCGCSRYGKKLFFQKVMMENGSDYEVSRLKRAFLFLFLLI